MSILMFSFISCELFIESWSPFSFFLGYNCINFWLGNEMGRGDHPCSRPVKDHVLVSPPRYHSGRKREFVHLYLKLTIKFIMKSIIVLSHIWYYVRKLPNWPCYWTLITNSLASTLQWTNFRFIQDMRTQYIARMHCKANGP